MRGSLEQLRVIDLTTSIAGPFATQILGDLGADVIKVERPPDGDNSRAWGPPFWGESSAKFLAHNRNKRSIVLDLTNEEDKAIFVALADEADILVQNLRPGVMDNLGLGHEHLRSRNPRLIYCEITAYGPVGPLKDRPAFDPLVQAFGGLMSLTGEEGRAPTRIPASILDQGSAMWSVIGILDALRRRDVTGEGGLVQTSLLQTSLMWLPSQFVGYFADGVVPGPLGSGTIGIAPYEAFPTSDGWVIIAAGNENLWQRLCEAINRSELLEDSRFTQNPDRVAHRAELYEKLAETTTKKPSSAWMTILTSAGVPVTLIQTLDEVANHEQVAAIGGFQFAPHPRIDGFKLVNMPIQIDGEYYPIRQLPPDLDAQGADIRAEVEKRRSGAVGS